MFFENIYFTLLIIKNKYSKNGKVDFFLKLKQTKRSEIYYN